jgi:glycerol kinase
MQTVVSCAAGVYFVPAFGGLLAPHWRDDARGTLLGLSQFSNRHHIVRAVLEGIAFQVRDVLAAVAEDSGKMVTELRVDGGAAKNDLLMQLQVLPLHIPHLRYLNGRVSQ